MAQPTWRQLKIVTVPEREGVIWTPALDYLTPGKLYRVRVEPRTVSIDFEASETAAVEDAPKGTSESGGKPAAEGTGNKLEAALTVGPTPFQPAPDPRDRTAAPGGGTAGQQAAAGAGTTAAPAGSKKASEVQKQLRDQYWKPESAADCTADGIPGLKRQNPLLMPNGAVGALIGKIGGSAGDTDFDKDKVVLFTVGRHYVFIAPDAPKVGSLYLGMNDTLASAAKAEKELKVTIWEAL